MNAKEKEFWRRSKAKWQALHNKRKQDVDLDFQIAFKAAQDFGYYKGKAEGTLKSLFHTMEYVFDDHFDLLISPDTLDEDDNEENNKD